MFDRIEFMFGEAFQGMRRHGIMTFAAVTTVAIALYLLGGLTYLYFQVNQFSGQLASRYEIQASFKDGTSKTQISEAAQKIRVLPGVKSAVWIPKDKAWEKQQKQNPELTAGLENPLPDSLKITMADVAKVPAVVDSVKRIPTIQPDEVMHFEPLQRYLVDTSRMIQWLGVVLGGLLSTIAGILIYNAIRLTIDGRRKEIRIMQLVGASHLTVRIPFFIEGFVQGLLGGLGACGLLYATYRWVDWYVNSNLTVIGKLGEFNLLPTCLVLSAIGAFYGTACSVLAIHGPARLRAAGV